MNEFVDKYRPRRLEDLVGQQHVIAQVQGMLENRRIPRQILISGTTGIGKTSLARILAYLFNKVKYGRSLPDLLERDIGGERGIEAIREIAATANYAPHQKYRVIILDEVHRITSAAAPAILKPLEDAAKQTIWILATSEPHLLLPTIVRRCYQLTLRPPTTKEVLPLLAKICQREKIKFPQHDKLLREIAALGQGQPALCLQLLQGAADADVIGSDYKQIIQAAFVATPVLHNTQLAVKCLICIYRQRVGQVLQIVSQVGGDTIPFVNALLNMNRWLIEHRFEQAKWRSPLTDRMIQYLGKIAINDLITTHQALVELRAEVQRFLLPEIHLLTARLLGLANKR